MALDVGLRHIVHNSLELQHGHLSKRPVVTGGVVDVIELGMLFNFIKVIPTGRTTNDQKIIEFRGWRKLIPS